MKAVLDKIYQISVVGEEIALNVKGFDFIGRRMFGKSNFDEIPLSEGDIKTSRGDYNAGQRC